MTITITRKRQNEVAAIRISFATQRELDIFGSLLNHSAINDAMQEMNEGTDLINEQYLVVEKAGANIHNDIENIGRGIANALCMAKFFKSPTPHQPK